MLSSLCEGNILFVGDEENYAYRGQHGGPLAYYTFYDSTGGTQVRVKFHFCNSIGRIVPSILVLSATRFFSRVVYVMTNTSDYSGPMKCYRYRFHHVIPYLNSVLKLRTNDMRVCLSGDLKFIYTILGLDGATATYPCPWCKAHKNKLEIGELRTIGEHERIAERLEQELYNAFQGRVVQDVVQVVQDVVDEDATSGVCPERRLHRYPWVRAVGFVGVLQDLSGCRGFPGSSLCARSCLRFSRMGEVMKTFKHVIPPPLHTKSSDHIMSSIDFTQFKNPIKNGAPRAGMVTVTSHQTLPRDLTDSFLSLPLSFKFANLDKAIAQTEAKDHVKEPYVSTKLGYDITSPSSDGIRMVHLITLMATCNAFGSKRKKAANLVPDVRTDNIEGFILEESKCTAEK
eukprot:gene18730-877_t